MHKLHTFYTGRFDILAYNHGMNLMQKVAKRFFMQLHSVTACLWRYRHHKAPNHVIHSAISTYSTSCMQDVGDNLHLYPQKRV